MKKLNVIFMLCMAMFYCNDAYADKGKVVTYQTMPNSTVRDWRAPTHVTETSKNGTVTTYQTMPNSTVRDWTAPSYVTEKKK